LFVFDKPLPRSKIIFQKKTGKTSFLSGIQKNEINWEQVAAVVIGIAVVGSDAGYLGGLQANLSLQNDSGMDGSSTGGGNDSAC